RSAAEGIHAASDARERHCDLRAHRRRQRLCHAARCAAERARPGVRHQRAQDRIPHRLPPLHPVRDHRPRGGERAHVHGHDDGLAGAHLPALQADALRARRRLGARHGHARAELLSLIRATSMTPDTIMTIGSRALEMALALAAPLLLAALLTGVVIGAFQAATSINEMTLSFIPKLIAISLTLAVPWMLKTLVGYTRELIVSIPGLIN